MWPIYISSSFPKPPQTKPTAMFGAPNPIWGCNTRSSQQPVLETSIPLQSSPVYCFGQLSSTWVTLQSKSSLVPVTSLFMQAQASVLCDFPTGPVLPATKLLLHRSSILRGYQNKGTSGNKFWAVKDLTAYSIYRLRSTMSFISKKLFWDPSLPALSEILVCPYTRGSRLYHLLWELPTLTFQMQK